VNLEAADRLIAVHGNRFILHLVFRALGTYDTLDQPEFDKIVKRVSPITEIMLSLTAIQKDKQAKGSYPANVFKNASKCKGLADAVSQTPLSEYQKPSA
jgi:hypothetical protein